MNARLRSISALCFAVGLGLGTAAAFGEVWMTAPQLCRGNPHSEEARAAAWQFDPEQRVSIATADSPAMSTSVFPGEGSNFVVNVSLRIDKDAQCRLTLGETTFDVTNSGSETQLRVGEKTGTVENTTDDARTWTLLTIRRRDGRMNALINKQPAIDLGESTRALEKITLQATRGRIAVRNFSLTGDLQSRTKRPPH